jgi:phage FluMu protein Com
MNQIKFKCSHCDQKLASDEQYSGREISCPACHGLTVVPAIPGKPAPVLQKSGMTFVPETWKKPDSGKTTSSPKKQA